jgi:hypothetical protein
MSAKQTADQEISMPSGSWGFPQGFHDHVVIVAVMQSDKCPDNFRVMSSQHHPDPIVRAIESAVRYILSVPDNWYEVVIKCRTHHDFDRTHSLALQLEHTTDLHGARMLCFSFDICASTEKCPDGLFIRSEYS